MTAICYVAFGLAAFVAREFNTHFLLFVFTGALAGVPLAGRKAVGGEAKG